MAKRPHTSKKPAGSGTYWLWGRHACGAALSNPERRIRRIVVSPALVDALELHKDHPRPEVLDNRAIEGYTGAEAVHQGVALEVLPLEPLDLEDILLFPLLPENRPVTGIADKPLIILDQVTDPHNVGAILRSAAAFDAAAVILPRDHAAPQGGVMARAAAGALDIVPLVYVTNLARALGEIKEAGYWVVGLDGEATTGIADAKLNRKTALVLGAEGKGMRRLTADTCDLLVKLPIHPQMESLNVSNAAAIALYELSRS